jgi:hypothetical protein
MKKKDKNRIKKIQDTINVIQEILDALNAEVEKLK